MEVYHYSKIFFWIGYCSFLFFGGGVVVKEWGGGNPGIYWIDWTNSLPGTHCVLRNAGLFVWSKLSWNNSGTHKHTQLAGEINVSQRWSYLCGKSCALNQNYPACGTVIRLNTSQTKHLRRHMTTQYVAFNFWIILVSPFPPNNIRMNILSI